MLFRSKSVGAVTTATIIGSTGFPQNYWLIYFYTLMLRFEVRLALVHHVHVDRYGFAVAAIQ